MARDALERHWKVIFNGDGYDTENQDMLTKKGVWRIDSGVDAICRLGDSKNLKLFSDLNVLSMEETEARRDVLLGHYTGTVEIEAFTMVDMINKHVLPSMKKANIGSSPIQALEKGVNTIKFALHNIEQCKTVADKAAQARVLRLETMESVRETCDDCEAKCPANEWTLATYKDLLFVDHTLQL